MAEKVVEIRKYICASCGGPADVTMRMQPEALTAAGEAMLKAASSSNIDSGSMCVTCCVRHAGLNVELHRGH